MQKWEYCLVEVIGEHTKYKSGIYVFSPNGTMQELVDLEKVKKVDIGHGTRVVDPWGTYLLNAINDLGDVGWEVISDFNSMRILLKRPKQT